MSGWIEKLPSGRFRARYRGPDGTRHSIIVATKAEAKTFLAGAHTDLNRGHWIDPRGGEETVAAWAARWAEARVIRESTRCTDDGRLRTRIVPTFGALALKDVTPLVVRSWVARMVADGLSPKTVRHYLMLFSLMMKDAVREGLASAQCTSAERVPAPVCLSARTATRQPVRPSVSTNRRVSTGPSAPTPSPSRSQSITA